MTTTDTPAAVEAGAEPAERLALESGHGEIVPDDQHAHHSPAQYVFIAVVLGALTALEVWLSYSSLDHTPQTVLLVCLMVLKFALVVMYFMHLRFDKPVFRRFFVTGLLLAIGVYLIVLLAEHADVNHSSETPTQTSAPAAAALGG